MPWKCTSPTCRLASRPGKCGMSHTCGEGRFRKALGCVDDLGEWTVKPRAARGGPTPWCATLKCRHGRVEVWGGAHAHEVWAVWRDGREQLVDPHWTTMTLRRAVDEAAALVGRMEVVA